MLPYRCNLCDNKTGQSAKTQTHLACHANFCDVCDIVAISRKLLKIHRTLLRVKSRSGDEKIQSSPANVVFDEPSDSVPNFDSSLNETGGYESLWEAGEAKNLVKSARDDDTID